jgi:hypothetical protein
MAKCVLSLLLVSLVASVALSHAHDRPEREARGEEVHLPTLIFSSKFGTFSAQK